MTILDVVLDDGLPWIVMELVQAARTLDDIIKAGPVPPSEVARIGLGVLDALTAAHELGVTHRDVKPANILIDSSGRVVLVDFGVAVHESDPTITSGVIGTPAYMAPERYDGVRSIPASDLFSLGVTLCQAAEGKNPFARSTYAAILRALLYDDPVPVRLSGGLAATVTGLLHKVPDRRLSAADARRGLERALRRSASSGVDRPGPASATSADRKTENAENEAESPAKFTFRADRAWVDRSQLRLVLADQGKPRYATRSAPPKRDPNASSEIVFRSLSKLRQPSRDVEAAVERFSSPKQRPAT